MTTPSAPDPSGGGLLGQILIKQGELGTQLAVISEQLKAVPDHETRIRSLEKWRYSMPISLLVSLASIVLTILKLTGR